MGARTDYDVIVVGSGPAGSSAASELARQGCSASAPGSRIRRDSSKRGLPAGTSIAYLTGSEVGQTAGDIAL